MHIRSTRVAAVLVAVAASGTSTLGAVTPAAAAATDAYLFSAVADTYVESSSPSTDFGRAERLVADAEPVTEAYLRFAVAGVKGTVTSARLRLYALDASGRTGGTVVRMQSTRWSESGTTYATRPGTTGRSVATIGPVKAASWVDVDVTSAIAGNGVVSFGIRTDSRDGVDYASRHAGLRAPRLIVTSTSAASGGDSTPPRVAISKPATGTRVTSSTRVSIEAAASDASGVRKVEFYANGLYMGTEETSPFGYTWSVSSADNGAHRWTARAYDRAGNVATSASVTVVVDIVGQAAPITTDAQVPARAETASVRHSGDAADDPAIWRHPTNPSLSLVLGTDKEGGLAVYDLQGRERQYIAGIRPNNVDLRGDIVTASDRDTDTILVYRVDRAARRLVDIRAAARDTGFGVAGLCMYSSRTGLYVFVTDSSGTVKQFRLFRTASGRYDYRQVRQLEVSSSEIEGCVADDYHGGFYVSDEDRAIWRYGAEPTSGSTRVKIDGHSSGRLSGDIEGLAVVKLGHGRGYLIASSQGSDSYAVYERRTHRYRGRFRIAGAGSVDGVTYTDGIDASGQLGLFVAQDDSNDGGNQNFKLVAWPRIAAALGLGGARVAGHAAPTATVL